MTNNEKGKKKKKKEEDFFVYCDYYEILHYISYKFKHLNSYVGINSLSYIFHISKEDTILEVEHVKPNFEIKEASKQEDRKMVILKNKNQRHKLNNYVIKRVSCLKIIQKSEKKR